MTTEQKVIKYAIDWLEHEAVFMEPEKLARHNKYIKVLREISESFEKTQ